MGVVVDLTGEATSKAKTARDDPACDSTEAESAEDGDASPTWKDVEEMSKEEKVRRLKDTLTLHKRAFSWHDCGIIEGFIDHMVAYAAMGGFQGPHTVDTTGLRAKYFFGAGYTYGWGKKGTEALLPLGAVDPIPGWIHQFVILPLEQQGIVERGWINSVVVNDYHEGSSIVGHVDPPQLFARPIFTASFFQTGSLVFNASFDPKRTIQPIHKQHLPRGSVLCIDGFAANKVSHGMRPEDMTGARRTSLVLRHILADAPRLESVVPVSQNERREMLAQLQGYWRDLDHRFFYVVNDADVMVFHAETAKYKTQWSVEHVEQGLGCRGGLLEKAALLATTAFWRRQTGDAERDKDTHEGFTWIRLEEGVAGSLSAVLSW